MSRSRAVLLTLALVAAGAGCGGDDDGGSSTATADDVPAGSVAIVGDAEITRSDLAGRADSLARAGSKSRRARLETEALTTLLYDEAIEQEARARGIAVPTAEARRAWRATSRRQFETRRDLKRFLGGQTEADVIRQLRIQMLSQRIDAQVREQAGGDKQGDAAAKQFQERFRERWKRRTACAEGTTAPGC